MYSKSVYERALAQKEKEARINKGKYAQKITEIASKCGELGEIDMQLKNIGARIAVAALGGDTKELSSLQNKSAELMKKKETLNSELGFAEYEPLCTLCNDTGYTENGKLCNCVKAKATEIALNDLAAVAPLNTSTFRNFNTDYYADTEENGIRDKMKNTFEYCKNYAENFSLKSESILLFGGTGLGKTHLSLAIAGEVIKKGYGVLYGSAQNMFNQMSKEHFTYSEDADALMFESTSCDLLIIDDLGAEFETQFTLSCVYNIINTRQLKGLPTIISTNLTFAELEKAYSPRVVSRIFGSYSMKKFEGNDIRQMIAISKRKSDKN